MTLIDTSAWVEYLRATGSGAHRAVRHLPEADAEVQTTDVVVVEVVAGARATSTSIDSVAHGPMPVRPR